jgi:hypothetical protein
VIRDSDRTRIAVIDEGLPKLVTHPYQSKGYSRLPNLPCGRLGSRKERYGLSGNRPLNYLAKSILVNVGSLYRDAKVSSPPMTGIGVGGSMVLVGVTPHQGARESRVQGEGSQSIGKSAKTNRMKTG